MPRRPRGDDPGTVHHVTNRAVARRTMFETRRDVEIFLALVQEAVERGEIEVYAFCVMTTHFHLLVGSPQGLLHRAMQRIQTDYSRSFNRGRKRDGSLVRGRYFSRPVESKAYLHAVIGYIDRNPVAARIVARARDYPYGSAAIYCRHADESDWIERSLVEDEVCGIREIPVYDPSSYEGAFDLSPALETVVEKRLSLPAGEDPLDDLVASAPPRVREWMRAKARLADGTRPGLPVVDLDSLERAIEERDGGPWSIGRRDGWRVLRAGLAHLLGGASQQEVATRYGLTTSTVSNLVRLHKRLLADDPQYGERAAAVAHDALRVWRR